MFHVHMPSTNGDRILKRGHPELITLGAQHSLAVGRGSLAQDQDYVSTGRVLNLWLWPVASVAMLQRLWQS